MTSTAAAAESTTLANDQADRPDPEVPEKAQRRRFSIAYKLRILGEADHCSQPGEIGALLRREGLYSSQFVFIPACYVPRKSRICVSAYFG